MHVSTAQVEGTSTMGARIDGDPGTVSCSAVSGAATGGSGRLRVSTDSRGLSKLAKLVFIKSRLPHDSIGDFHI